MFDLKTGVHLHEEEAVLAQPVAGVDDELHRSRPFVTNGPRRFAGGLAHDGAQFVGHAGRGRFLDHLLVAALHGTVPLAEMDHIAVAVGKDLHFDVAWRSDEAFDQHVIVAE